MANLNYYKHKLKHLSLTEWLIGINIFMFLLTQIADYFTGNGLLFLGSKVNALIGLGEFWRLFTAMFLHADFLHLMFNMMALYVIGRDIERFYGKRNFLIIYFISGLIGSGASFLFSTATSVGASGAIFGLMGANLFLYKLNPIVYKKLFGSDLILLVGINLLIGLVKPNIDMAGHIGGLIGGFFLAYSVGLSHEKIFHLKRLPVQVISVLLLVVPIVLGTLKVQADPEIFLQGAAYYYQDGKAEKAIRTLEKGQKKYPDQSIYQEWIDEIEQDMN